MGQLVSCPPTTGPKVRSGLVAYNQRSAWHCVKFFPVTAWLCRVLCTRANKHRSSRQYLCWQPCIGQHPMILPERRQRKPKTTPWYRRDHTQGARWCTGPETTVHFNETARGHPLVRGGTHHCIVALLSVSELTVTVTV